MFIIAAFVASGLQPIRDLRIGSALAATLTAKSNAGVSTLDIGERSIRTLTTPSIVGSGDVIAAPIDATIGLRIPTLAYTTPPTCDSGGPAAAWPLLA